MKIKVFYQINNSDCGLQALKSMLYYYSNGKNLIQNENLFHKEYSFKELKEIAYEHKMVVEGYKISNVNYQELKPSIIQVKNFNRTHMLFFIKAKKDKLYVIDPNYGKRIISYEEMDDIFLGNVLLFKSIKIDKKRVRINLELGINLILEFFLSIPFFLLILFFILQKVIPFFVICLLIISIFSRKIIVIFRMKNFDKKLDEKFKLTNINETFIKKLYAFKKAKFSYYPTLYNFILYNFSFFLFTLLLKNGYLITLLYFVYLIYSLISFKKDTYKLSTLMRISAINNDLYQKYHEMNVFTNKYILKKEITKLFFGICLVILTIILNVYFYKSNELVFSLSLFIFYLISREDLYSLYQMNKDLEIGNTIYRNLK